MFPGFPRHRSWLLLLGVAGCVCAANAYLRAQPAERPTDSVVAALADNVEQFLEGVGAAQAATAFEALLVDSPLARQRDAAAALVAKTQELEPKYGRLRGIERISARRIGQDVVLLNYLYKCETCPIVWRVAYYRTALATTIAPDRSRWVVVNVRFETDLDRLSYEADPAPR